jgi:capsular polysaccharide biosynthesis protein
MRGRSIGNHREVAQSIERVFPEWAGCSMSATHCSVPEQAKCFRAADLILGVEGAGLTNMLFSQRGTTVVNLHPNASFSTLQSDCGQSYYWHMAGSTGMHYHAYMMSNFSFGGSLDDDDTIAIRDFERFLAELRTQMAL